MHTTNGSQVLAVICQAFITTGVYYGTGRHLATLHPIGGSVALKMNYLSQCFALASICVGKLSVSYLLFRIMGPTRSAVRAWFLYMLMALLIAINVATVGIIFGQCTPTRKLWEPSISGHCLPAKLQPDYSYFQGAFSGLSDLVLALFPTVIIWNLKMKLHVKIGIGSAMGLGVFASAAAIVKTYELRLLNAKSDFTYVTVGLIIWFSTEMYVIIIAACVPTLRPLLPLLHGRLPVSRKSGRRNQEIYSHILKRDKKAVQANESDDSHHLPFIYPPLTHEDSHKVLRGHPDTSIRSALPPNAQFINRSMRVSNEIEKTTEVDVSTVSQLSHERVTRPMEAYAH